MSEVPSGWSHNPSAWTERRHLIAMAAIGFAIAIARVPGPTVANLGGGWAALFRRG